MLVNEYSVDGEYLSVNGEIEMEVWIVDGVLVNW
jgi:hypothetical protein